MRRPSAIRIAVYLIIASLGTAALYADRFATPDGEPVLDLGTVLSGRTSQGLPVQGYVRGERLTSLVVSWRGPCSDDAESTLLRARFGPGIRHRGQRFSARGLRGRLAADGAMATGTFEAAAGLVRGDGSTVTCGSGVLGFRAGV